MHHVGVAPAASTPPPNPFLRTDKDRASPPGRQPRSNLGRSWLITFAVLLLINVIVTNVLASRGTSRITIPYTTFKQQVVANNVQSIVAMGDIIDGHANKAITSADGTQSSQDFETEVPSFAGPLNSGQAGANLQARVEEDHAGG